MPSFANSNRSALGLPINNNLKSDSSSKQIQSSVGVNNDGSNHLKWHELDTATVVATLQTDENAGLTSAEAAVRLGIHGHNALRGEKKRNFFMRIFDQINSIVIYVLIVAGIVSAAVEHYVDTGVIFAVVLINIVIGMIMEGRAESATDSLSKMLAAAATVVRNGQQMTIPATELTVGDIVRLKPGDSIPADIRLLEVASLQVQEAMLTGEAANINKITRAVEHDAAIGDRKNMAFSGTLVMFGTGRGVVVEVGDNCEIGKINKMVGAVKQEKTPLMHQLEIFGRWVSLFVLIVGAVSFGVAMARGSDAADAFSVAVGVAVAAIPEGLPTIITITFAVGVKLMVKSHAIMAGLASVEVLGSVSVICSDKTGTLTCNAMTVVCLETAKGKYRVTGTGYAPHGDIFLNEKRLPLTAYQRLANLMLPGILCNESAVYPVLADGVLSDETSAAHASAASSSSLDSEHPVSKFAGDLESEDERMRQMSGGSKVSSNEDPHTLAVRKMNEYNRKMSIISQRVNTQDLMLSSTMVPTDEAAGPHAAPQTIIEMDKLDTETKWAMIGNPTEAALLTMALKCGVLDVAAVCNDGQLVASIPFDSQHKFMASQYHFRMPLNELPSLKVKDVTILSRSKQEKILSIPCAVHERRDSKIEEAAAIKHCGSVAKSLNMLDTETPEDLDELQPAKRHDIVFVKGAPERMLIRCKWQLVDDRLCKQEPIDMEHWLVRASEMASEGLRVLALCSTAPPPEGVELDVDYITTGEPHLTLHGLAGIIDPPRPEVIDAIASCKSAKITLKMITGDHPITACVIGRKIGITSASYLTGPDIERMTDEQLALHVRDVNIYARASPEHKLRIVKALQVHRQVVAMTGDGVNDSPALKQAEIGVAMGITGTEVAKRSAKMILTDDNFATIVEAVRVGRGVYDNLKKIILFILPTNFAQALCIVWALIIDLAVPITAVQILWVNLVTSITLGLVLAFEPVEPNVMCRKPRRMGKGVLGKLLLWRTVFVTTLLIIAVLLVYAWDNYAGYNGDQCQTSAVNTLFVCQIFYLLNCRFIRAPSLRINILFENTKIPLGIIIACVFQALFTYVPPFNTVFGTEHISVYSWLKAVLAGVVVFAAVEVDKKTGPFVVHRICLPLLRAFKAKFWCCRCACSGCQRNKNSVEAKQKETGQQEMEAGDNTLAMTTVAHDDLQSSSSDDDEEDLPPRMLQEMAAKESLQLETVV